MLTRDAVDFFEGKTKLAAALRITPAAVSQWRENVPKLRQYQLVELSNGALKMGETKRSD